MNRLLTLSITAFGVALFLQVHAANEATSLAEAFKAEKNFFDQETQQWFNQMHQNAAKVAEQFNSPHARASTEIAEMGLSGLMENFMVCRGALQYWKNDICSNEKLQELYKKDDFTQLRKEYAPILRNLIAREFGITSPKIDPSSKEFVQNFFEINENVKINENAKIRYFALILLQAVARQIHRNNALDTDDPNLLAPKEITDPQG